ncbi:MAG: hypothetical protein PHW77_03525 [Eubacteriales bacterium]|nr:hypothetical protein [Eubacteriales bacterium]
MEDADYVKSDDSKSAALYYCITAFVLLLFVASACFIRLLAPVYEKPLHGNIKELLIYLTVIILWLCELTAAALFCKNRFKFNLLWNDEKKSRLPILNFIVIWVLIYGAILLVSGILGWQLKIFHDLGTKITFYEIYTVLSLVLLRAVESVIICAFIKCTEEAAKRLIPVRLPIPYGGIALFLTYGIGVYVYSGSALGLYGGGELSLLFWLFCILYGVIYKLSKESFPVTSILIWFVLVL